MWPKQPEMYIFQGNLKKCGYNLRAAGAQLCLEHWGGKELLGRQKGVLFRKKWVLLHFYVTISKYWDGRCPLAAPGATPLRHEILFDSSSCLRQFFCQASTFCRFKISRKKSKSNFHEIYFVQNICFCFLGAELCRSN